MENNASGFARFAKLTLALIAVIIGLVIISCSPEYHKKKFEKKGGVFDCSIDTVSLVDTVIQDGDTSYLFRDSLVIKKEFSYIPKYVVKYKYKERKQEIKHEAKAEVKKHRIDARLIKEIQRQAHKTERVDLRQGTIITGLVLIGAIFALFLFLKRRL